MKKIFGLMLVAVFCFLATAAFAANVIVSFKSTVRFTPQIVDDQFMPENSAHKVAFSGGPASCDGIGFVYPHNRDVVAALQEAAKKNSTGKKEVVKLFVGTGYGSGYFPVEDEYSSCRIMAVEF